MLARPAAPPARAGRPTREGVALLEARMLAEATDRFLRDGFAATSMESVAAGAGVSKRTLYRRYPDKAALMQAVVAGLVAGWRPAFDAAIVRETTLVGALTAMARAILAVALTPEALALHRLVVAEAGRVPELGTLVRRGAMDAGTREVAGRLGALWPNRAPEEVGWAAEQFLHMVVTGPQRRGLGLGPPLDADGTETWVQRTVRLFLQGVG